MKLNVLCFTESWSCMLVINQKSGYFCVWSGIKFALVWVYNFCYSREMSIHRIRSHQWFINLGCIFLAVSHYWFHSWLCPLVFLITHMVDLCCCLLLCKALMWLCLSYTCIDALSGILSSDPGTLALTQAHLALTQAHLALTQGFIDYSFGGFLYFSGKWI